MVQNEVWLKCYYPSTARPEKAPTSLEHRWWPKALKQRKKETMPNEVDLPSKLPPVPEPGEVVPPKPVSQVKESAPEETLSY